LGKRYYNDNWINGRTRRVIDLIEYLKVSTFMSKDSNIQDELSSSMTGGRLRRYAKVTTAMGGLAARLAGEKYLGIKINRQQHASDLRAALGGLKGPLMKVAQILATIPDALPREYVNELSHPSADAPLMGLAFC